MGKRPHLVLSRESVRRSNAPVIEFYQRIGFKTDDVISLGKRLEAGN